jgi:hypothetical protein
MCGVFTTVQLQLTSSILDLKMQTCCRYWAMFPNASTNTMKRSLIFIFNVKFEVLKFFTMLKQICFQMTNRNIFSVPLVAEFKASNI